MSSGTLTWNIHHILYTRRSMVMIFQSENKLLYRVKHSKSLSLLYKKFGKFNLICYLFVIFVYDIDSFIF